MSKKSFCPPCSSEFKAFAKKIVSSEIQNKVILGSDNTGSLLNEKSLKITVNSKASGLSKRSKQDAKNKAKKKATKEANAKNELANYIMDTLIKEINKAYLAKIANGYLPEAMLAKITETKLSMQIRNKQLGITTNWTSSSASYSVSFRNTPYLELQYADQTTGQINVYSCTIFDNGSQLLSTYGSDLNLEAFPGTSSNPAINNNNRYYIWDRVINNITTTGSSSYPLNVTIPFVDQYNATSGSNTYEQQMKLVATTPLKETAYYNTTSVNRQSIYVYYPLSMIYILVCLNDTTNSTTIAPATSDPKIYVMQTYSNKYFSQTVETLSNLKNILLLPTGTQPSGSENTGFVTLPDGWNFLCVQVPNDLVCLQTSSADKEAILVSDGADNSYQYCYPQENPWLYEYFNGGNSTTN